MTKQATTTAAVDTANIDGIPPETREKIIRDAKLLLVGNQAVGIEMQAAGLPVEALQPVFRNAIFIGKHYLAERFDLRPEQLDAVLATIPDEIEDDGDAEALVAIHKRVRAEDRAAKEKH